MEPLVLLGVGAGMAASDVRGVVEELEPLEGEAAMVVLVWL
jgi:hypothetical protein